MNSFYDNKRHSLTSRNCVNVAIFRQNRPDFVHSRGQLPCNAALQIKCSLLVCLEGLRSRFIPLVPSRILIDHPTHSKSWFGSTELLDPTYSCQVKCFADFMSTRFIKAWTKYKGRLSQIRSSSNSDDPTMEKI